MVDWRHAVDGKWGGLRFGDLRVESKADQHVFEVEILLNDLDSNAVRVELYADGINGGAAERVEMKQASGGSLYTAAVSNARPAARLHAASDPAALRRGGSAGIRSDPVATVIEV